MVTADRFDSGGWSNPASINQASILADQYPGRPPRRVVDRGDIDASKQSRLAPLVVTPHLG